MRLVFTLLAVAASIAGSSCRSAEGTCTGQDEGAPAAWEIDGESFYREGGAPMARSAVLAYRPSSTLRWIVDLDMHGEALTVPHEQDLAKDDRGEVIDQSFVTSWSEQRLEDDVGNVAWPVQPTRRITVTRLDEDGMAGSLELFWPEGDEVTCTFDLPRVTGGGSGGGDGPTPCGFHGC